MKAKPLKGDVIGIIFGRDFDWNNDMELYKKEDIESAVEWFIQNLREDINKTGAIMMIKEAFEDVTK